MKPVLGIHLWGPKYSNMDNPDDYKHDKESLFSTFTHIHKEDCPAFNDNSKKIYHKPFINDEGQFVYPCNIGGCGKVCECFPCKTEPELKVSCPEHPLLHPCLFNPEEDFLLPRRILFDVENVKPIYNRPSSDSTLRRPNLKLAGLKTKFKTC